MYSHWTVPYIIHGTLAVVSAVLAFIILPETANKSLPEHVPDRLRERGNVTKTDKSLPDHVPDRQRKRGHVKETETEMCGFNTAAAAAATALACV